MKLTRFTTAPAFLARAESFLLARETLHTLPLGLARTLAQNPNYYPDLPYFAVIEEAGTVLATGLMTPPHGLALSYIADVAVFPLLAADVFAFRPNTPGTSGAQPWSVQFGQAWQALTGQPYRVHMAERLYALTQVTAPVGIPGAPRRVTEADRPLLEEWVRAFFEEAIRQFDETQVQRTAHNLISMSPELRSAFLWEVAGQPVSLVAYGARTPNTMRIGPVYTPQHLRGHGYASACTAATSQYLLTEQGVKTCVLFTDLNNPTSNKIYQAIGYAPVCNVDDVRFGAASH